MNRQLPKLKDHPAVVKIDGKYIEFNILCRSFKEFQLMFDITATLMCISSSIRIGIVSKICNVTVISTNGDAN
jgi:hypothetical protein